MKNTDGYWNNFLDERQEVFRLLNTLASQFVADFAQQILAPGNPGFVLDPFALSAIDHAHNTAPLLGFGNHDFDGVGSGAKDAAYLRNIFYRVQYVNREKSWAQE